MKKQFLLLGVLILIFSIVSIQAVTIIPISPESLPNVSMGCGEIVRVDLKLSMSNENFSVSWQTKYSLLGLIAPFENNYFSVTGVGDRHLIIYYSTQSNCGTGTQTRTLNIGDETYDITVIVKEDLFPLNEGLPFALAEGQKFSIGNTVHFNLLDVGSTFVDYSLEGCGSSETRLYVGDILEKICGTERLGVKIVEILGVDSATFNISFSTTSLTLTKSDSDTNGVDPSECVLGIDTLGAVVKRGSVFAFNTINANTGKYESGVIVNVLDQAGDLTPLSGTSDNTGFFSKRIHEDYKQDLLIKLFKEGCEPTNKVILFERSYDDYKKAKAEEEGAYQLVLNMSEKYEVNKEIDYAVKNALDETIEGVTVKITKPDNSVFEVQTDSTGLFKWTPDVVGKWKIQAGKDGYESSELNEIQVFQNQEYLVITKVDGKQKTSFKKGDRLTFELRDENNTFLPLTIDATFDGYPLKFVGGISDTVTFEDTSTLVISATEGYAEQSLQLTRKKPKTLLIIGIIVGIIILILVIVVIKNAKRSKSSLDSGDDAGFDVGEK